MFLEKSHRIHLINSLNFIYALLSFFVAIIIIIKYSITKEKNILIRGNYNAFNYAQIIIINIHNWPYTKI